MNNRGGRCLFGWLGCCRGVNVVLPVLVKMVIVVLDSLYAGVCFLQTLHLCFARSPDRARSATHLVLAYLKCGSELLMEENWETFCCVPDCGSRNACASDGFAFLLDSSCFI